MIKQKIGLFLFCLLLLLLIPGILSTEDFRIEQALLQIVNLSLKYDELITLLKASVSSLEQELTISKQESQSLKDLMKAQESELTTLRQESTDLKKELEKQLSILSQLMKDSPELKTLLEKWEGLLKIKDLTVQDLVQTLESKLKSCKQSLVLSQWVIGIESAVIVILSFLYALTFVK